VERDAQRHQRRQLSASPSVTRPRSPPAPRPLSACKAWPPGVRARPRHRCALRRLPQEHRADPQGSARLPAQGEKSRRNSSTSNGASTKGITILQYAGVTPRPDAAAGGSQPGQMGQLHHRDEHSRSSPRRTHGSRSPITMWHCRGTS
jgi:hypothetical protein